MFNSVIDLLKERCQSTPDMPLYYFSPTGLAKDNICITYATLEKKILATAAKIQSHTQPGQRALLIFEPGIDYIVAFWACLYVGVIAIPAYPPFDKNTVEKLQAIVDNATPALILSNTQIINNIKRLGLLQTLISNKLLKKLFHKFTKNTADLCEWDFQKFFWLDISKETPSVDLKCTSVPSQINDVAYLQYTSGSTAMPKGVMVTHGNLLANMELIFETIDKKENERLVSWLPPYHDMGLICNLLFPVYCQYTIMMMSPITFLRRPYLWLKAISDFKGTISGGPNFAYELCEKRIELSQIEDDFDLASWRIAYNGAENINHTTLKNFHAKFAPYGFSTKSYYPIYGLAESTVFVSGSKNTSNPNYLSIEKEKFKENKMVISNNENPDAHILVSCGEPKVPVIIVSNSTQTLCAEGEIGEIWLYGDSVTKGYWKKEEETQHAFNASLNENNQQNYLRTGDLGFLYKKELYITGRIKDLIIINGKNHYPHDIELAIENSDTNIRAGGIAAFSITSQEQEKLAVVAELKKPLVLLTYSEIIQKIRLNISLHHGLEAYLIALLPPRTIPRTTSGKLRRSHTKKLLENNELNLLYKWSLAD